MYQWRENLPFCFAMLLDVCSQSTTGLSSFIRIPLSSPEVPGPAFALIRASLEMGFATYGHYRMLLISGLSG